MPTPIESLGLYVAAEIPKRPYTNEFPFVAGKTLVTTGVGLEVIAGDAPGEFLDSTFRIKDNLDTTKKIAFQASGIATDEERTITMPNADVDLGKVAQAASESSNGYLTSSDWTSFNNKEQRGYITVSSSFTAELGKKYRTVWGLNSAITITPPVTTTDGDSFTVYYSYMAATGSVSCTDPDISANQGNSWHEFEYTYDGALGGWLHLRKSLGVIVPAGGSFQLTHPTNYSSKCIFQLPDTTNLAIINMPAVGNINLGDLPFIATTNTNNLTNTTARILGGSEGTASKPNATIINGIGNTANGGLSVILTGNNVNTTLGGAVVQGAYQANDTGRPGYTGQAAIKQGVVIYAKTTTATSAAMDSAGGAAVTTAGDTKVIAAVVPNGMTGVTTGSAVHEITIIGKSITGTYQAFSAKYIITCSYDGTTYTIDSMTTLHTSSRNGALLSAAITLDGSNLTITATSGSAQTILWSGYVDSIYD